MVIGDESSRLNPGNYLLSVESVDAESVWNISIAKIETN